MLTPRPSGQYAEEPISVRSAVMSLFVAVRALRADARDRVARAIIQGKGVGGCGRTSKTHDSSPGLVPARPPSWYLFHPTSQ